VERLKMSLLIEALLSFCLAVILYFAAGLQNPVYLLSMPFEYMGKGLRWLSLSSPLGNIIALTLYIILSLLPLVYMIHRHLRSGLKKVDILLPVICSFVFYMLYVFVNPDLMLQRVPQLFAGEAAIPVVKMSFAVTFYALCVGYLILRMAGSLTLEAAGDKTVLLCRGLKKILVAVASLYTFGLGFIKPFQMFSDFGKYASEDRAPINALFIVIIYLLECLPVIFTIFTLVCAIKLVDEMLLNHMKEEEIEAAKRMGIMSRHTVYVTVIGNILLNILQLLFSSRLNNTSYHLEITLSPLIIAVSAIILSGFFKAAKELNEDNEMII
jgi:hypothetical protein